MFAYIFPGQGSQSVGMGKALSESSSIAKSVFEEVDDALGMDLTRIMFEGPKEELMLTENAQPALMAVSVAVLRVIDDQYNIFSKDKPYTAKYFAGHSLGEYSALVSSGSLELSDAAKLLKIRGRAMQDAVPVGLGAMAAFLGSDLKQAMDITKLASQGEICEVANDNGAGQVVISGTKFAVERAISLAKVNGVKKSMILPVSAPFHCKLMESAAEIMEDAFSKVTFNCPLIPIISNVSAKPENNDQTIKSLLIKQVTCMVRWRETMECMINAGIDSFVELGCGKVLTGIAKRTKGASLVMGIDTPEDFESFNKKI